MFDFVKEKISSVFNSLLKNKTLTASQLEKAEQELKIVLLEADVDPQAIDYIFDGIKEKLAGKKAKDSTPSELYIKLMYEKIVEMLGGDSVCELSFKIPSVIMVMGVQGSGKTTTIAKLANYIKKNAEKRGKKRRILLGSVDYYRPAAIEQLKILANQIGVDFYQSESTNPLEASQDIYKKMKNCGYEYLLLDTAGRLVADEALMSELESIDKALKPQYKYIVLDSMMGQQTIEIAKVFADRIGFDGAIITKTDNEGRCGAAVSFRYLLKKPVVMLGVGEKIDALEQFYPDRIAQRIIGLGDIKSLLEKAEEVINPKEQQSAMNAIMSGKFTLDDFAKQLDMVNKIGSFKNILGYLPGMGNMNISQDMIQKGEQETKKFRVMMQSMTLKEKRNHKLFSDISRKERVANGSGNTLEDVDNLLKRFEETSQFAKLLKKSNFSQLLKR